MDNVNIKTMLERALLILEQDIEHLSSEVSKGALQTAQSRSLNDSIRTLIMANKAYSELAKGIQKDLESMSDDELKEMASKLLGEV